LPSDLVCRWLDGDIDLEDVSGPPRGDFTPGGVSDNIQYKRIVMLNLIHAAIINFKDL